MASEYDPLFAPSDDAPDGDGDATLGDVRRSFRAAARPFLSCAPVWVSWAAVLPAAALASAAGCLWVAFGVRQSVK